MKAVGTSGDSKPQHEIIVRGNSRLENQAGATVQFDAPVNLSATGGTLSNAGALTFAGGGSVSLSSDARRHLETPHRGNPVIQ